MTLAQGLIVFAAIGVAIGAVWWLRRPADRSIAAVGAIALLGLVLLLYVVGILLSPAIR